MHSSRLFLLIIFVHWSSFFLQSTCAHSIGLENCGCTAQKPHVYVQQQPPIVIDRPPQSLVVKAPAPILVRPAPVIINRPGPVEVRPVVVKHQPKPVVVTKKILKVSRPIVKKYYVEKYSKTEPCPCNDEVVNDVHGHGHGHVHDHIHAHWGPTSMPIESAD